MDEDFYLNLIIKRLSNALNEEESQKLETWEAASEANRQFVAETEEAWNAASVLHRQPEVDLDEEFAFLEAKMDASDLVESPADDTPEEAPEEIPLTASPSPQLPRNRSRSKFVIGGIAAAVLLLIVISLNYLPIDLLSGGGPSAGKMVTVAAVDKMEKVILPDQSVAHIYPGSKLQYPEKFAEASRKVTLEGEGFFEVEKDSERMFQVQTELASITVHGTKFNVKTSPDQAEITVQVLEGIVELFPRSAKDGLYIKKGEAGTWNNKGQVLQSVTPAPNDLAWFTRKLIFAEIPLKDALPKIEKLYEVRLELKNPDLENCTLSSTFDEQSLEEILKELETIFGLQALPNGKNRFSLTGGQC